MMTKQNPANCPSPHVRLVNLPVLTPVRQRDPEALARKILTRVRQRDPEVLARKSRGGPSWAQTPQSASRIRRVGARVSSSPGSLGSSREKRGSPAGTGPSPEGVRCGAGLLGGCPNTSGGPARFQPSQPLEPPERRQGRPGPGASNRVRRRRPTVFGVPLREQHS